MWRRILMTIVSWFAFACTEGGATIEESTSELIVVQPGCSPSSLQPQDLEAQSRLWREVTEGKEVLPVGEVVQHLNDEGDLISLQAFEMHDPEDGTVQAGTFSCELTNCQSNKPGTCTRDGCRVKFRGEEPYCTDPVCNNPQDCSPAHCAQKISVDFPPKLP